MEKSIKGTQTEKNLLKSFAGESQAARKYEIFANVARKEGYEQIAAIFDETANHEKTHAKIFFEYLDGGMVEITASYPAGRIGDTIENLKKSAEGENEEWTQLYPEFAKTAEEEGFQKAANSFKVIAKVEEHHEKRYLELMERIKAGEVFERTQKIKWFCRKCGYVHESNKAPKQCPSCRHPQGYFEIIAENY